MRASAQLKTASCSLSGLNVSIESEASRLVVRPERFENTAPVFGVLVGVGLQFGFRIVGLDDA